MSDPLILASQSESRLALLRAAGVSVEPMAAHLDEVALRASVEAEGATPRDLADALAEAKAQKIALRLPGALVLGADQVLVKDGRVFEKVATANEARDVLVALSGGVHTLLSAAVIYEAGKPVWRTLGQVRMHMRPLSDAFLDNYLSTELPAILSSVGCYQLEGKGAQLFERVEGDYFSVLGLPLLPVLGFLRSRERLIP